MPPSQCEQKVNKIELKIAIRHYDKKMKRNPLWNHTYAWFLTDKNNITWNGHVHITNTIIAHGGGVVRNMQFLSTVKQD